MRRLVLPVLTLLVAGCTAEPRHYPSLALRPAEKQGFEEPTRPVATVVDDPALDTRIATQAASLDRIAVGFAKAAEAARRAIGSRPPAVGTDAWLDAQAAMGRVDDWRAQANALAADSDDAAATRAAKLLPPYPRLEALRGRITTETEHEAGVAAALQADLPAA